MSEIDDLIDRLMEQRDQYPEGHSIYDDLDDAIVTIGGLAIENHAARDYLGERLWERSVEPIIKEMLS